MSTFHTLLKIKCFKGWCQTINALFGLVEDLSIDTYFSHEFILPSRLNQDPLENLFAQVRSKGGCSTNPSVKQLNSILAKIVSIRILNFDFSTKNCESDDDSMLEYLQESIEAEDMALENETPELEDLELGFIEEMQDKDESSKTPIKNKIVKGKGKQKNTLMKKQKKSLTKSSFLGVQR